MLVFEDIINKMKIHFPRWMDIRRRIKTSNGGNYLSSIGEEIVDIQKAIDEYKKDFFIDKYIGKENDVLTFVYRYNIGIVENESLSLLNPKYIITDVEKDFYEQDNIAYYCEGFIYLKENLPEIEYSIDGYKSIASSEQYHIWNIFDEFAAFVGLRRYELEDNEKLLNRILSFANQKPNSSEEGLKNAIINNLKNDIDISKEDISIDRPTPQNLIKYYDEFETVLDHLANINRDVYRTKRWDLDTWNFKIKSVDYIPHAWDVVLEHYVNGVGFKDDLKVEIVDAEMKTNATIYFYKKTLEYINSYIKNNTINETIKLNLQKHTDYLKPVNVKYRITTTEIVPIQPSAIMLESYDFKSGNITKNVNDLFDEQSCEFQDVEIKDNRKLDPALTYKIRFKSKDALKEMKIGKLQIYNKTKNTLTNLLIAKPGFEKIAGHGVRCTLTKRYLVERYNYNYIENAIKDEKGFSIADVEKPTILKANIDGCENESIYYEYECEEVPINFQNISFHNCYINNDSILSDTVNGEKYIEFDIKANSLSFNVFGPNKIIYTINNENINTIENVEDKKHNFKLNGYNTPQNIHVRIILNPVNNKQAAISDLFYSSYEFHIETEKGEITTFNDTKRLPNSTYNTLIITMKTNIGFSPILKYIYIGTPLDNITYGDISIRPHSKDEQYIVMEKENCIAELEYYREQELEFTDIDYTAGLEIKGLSDNSYISVNLKDFKKFKSVHADRCIFETINYGSQIQHVIKIPAGVVLKQVSIIGEYEKMLFKESLANLLSRKGYLSKNYKFNIVKTNDKLIAISNNNKKVSFIRINKKDLISTNASKIKINHKYKNIETIFIEDSINKISTINNEYDGNFDYITFYPTSSKIYKAINEYNVISPITSVDKIINTFNNGYTVFSENSFYSTIESLNDQFDVMFSNENELLDYSIDSSALKIIKKDTTKMDFDYEEVTVVFDEILGNTISIPKTFTINKEKIELIRYVISNDNLDIQYLDKYNDKFHEKDYIYTEILNVNNLKCSKLKYCNVNEIEEIYIMNENNTNLVESTNYEIYKTEGVINWLKLDLDSSNKAKVFIKYNIRKARYIRFSLDQLYDKVNYSVNAYELLGTENLYEVKNGDNFNLNIYDKYAKSNLISVKCENIGFEAAVKDNMITFKKNIKNNTVAVKSGYYYLDGDEYYLFADKNNNNIEHLDNLYFFNVIKENKKLYLNQTTNNQISNSAFKTNAIGKIFDLDCTDKEIEGISKINSITTCNSFNYWNAIGMDMSITKGINGNAIKFTNINNIDGYSYLNISKHLEQDNEDYIVSFYMEGDGEAFIGEERVIYSQTNKFNKDSIIEPKSKALKSEINEKMYSVKFLNKNNSKFYLIVKGNIIIDDIIVQKVKDYSIDDHTKNITSLNLEVMENIYAEFQTRLYLDDEEGAIFEGTEKKDGYIFNSSYIDWGFTRKKKISTYEDFKKCTIENVDVIDYNNKGYVITRNEPGILETSSIYIGNVHTINNIVFKINDVMFSNMKNFKVKVLTSNNSTTGFKEISIHLDNIGAISGDKLSSYVKLIVEMPSNKVINNIELFIEYLSDANNNPPEVPVINGNYYSKILDAQYNARYLIKDMNFELGNVDISNVLFFVRATKENSENTVWTDWKLLKFIRNEENNLVLDSRIVFEGYRYFQFRTTLKGANASVKIKNLDIEVI